MPEWIYGEKAELWLWLAGLGALGWTVYLIARFVIVHGIRALVRRSAVTWDDALVDARVFIRMAHIAPALVIFLGIGLIEGVPDEIDTFVRRVSIAVMVVVTVATISSFLTAIDDIYMRSADNRRRPIKGYLQVLKIVFFLVGVLIVVSTLVGRSPWVFLSGIGALTAVLMLIFKDTILSLVASVQIASNDMIHVGDWIEMPNAGADGDVVDVALHTVKVQNWDKTISTIPTHRFINESFKNWRGMSESGGRRIKRSLHIDVNSVRFLRDDEIERFREWALLRDYIVSKQEEIERFNAEPARNSRVNADIRRLTNIGTLRAYVEAYLRAHPQIHTRGYTLMVRQLQPGPSGLPLEIYCFSNDQDWTRYESIQADVFDHILAIVPEFELRVYQEPAGADFDRVAPSGRSAASEASLPVR